MDIIVKAYVSCNSDEFKKHLKAVEFCIENDLSFPKETSEYFKGKVGGGDLEDYDKKYVLEYIQHGLQVDLPIEEESEYEFLINVKDIPKDVEKIFISMSY